MGPLEGVRILEMAGLAPGPYAAMLLADLGATVLRIEGPTPLGHSVPHHLAVIQRGRPSVRLNLKTQPGKQAFLTLVARSDALIEGFRPGVMERLGLGPEDCLACNPRLVYGRITGWGQHGPLAQSPGHDINYIAMTGLLDAIGPADGPPVVPLNLAGDFAGGGLFLALGIVSALLETKGSGKGQVVDTAMIDGASSLMSYFWGYHAAGKWQGRGTNVNAGVAPYYTVYATSDGKYISIGAAEPQFYAELLRLLQLDPAHLPDRNDRAAWPALRAILAGVFASRTRDQWCELLEGSGACFAPVLSMEEAVTHPHHRARATFIEIDGQVQPAPAPRFSRTPCAPPVVADMAGPQAEAAVLGWGLRPDERAAIVAAGNP